MPGPVIPGPVETQATKPEILQIRYKWRGDFSYMWFDIDDQSNKVVKEGWYTELVV
jgi:hypothetical protein